MTCFHTSGTHVVHAVAENITGPYEYGDAATPTETNNPHAVRGINGDYMLFHLNDNVAHPTVPTCNGGGPNPGPIKANYSRTPCGDEGHGTVGVALAKSPQGPWETIYPFCNVSVGAESIANPTAAVRPDGSILVAYRYSNGLIYKGSEAIAVASAPSVHGPYEVIAEDVTPLSVEDPHLYLDKRGAAHLFLHQYNCTQYNCTYGDPRMIPGAHAFSKDGRDWHTSEYPLFLNHVQWANGTEGWLNYRERPELILEDGRPAWLITGAELGQKYTSPPGPCQSFTMLTEILP
mmetsp:Transcript_14141/g.30702  ORF Transcript_14141/g.30702 Transcript_14141/m.30702 type:complete len:291 (-) Transcript_14141:33-905(-)